METEREVIPFEFYPGSTTTMKVIGNTITRVGRNGWKGLVRIMVKNRDCEKFTVRVDRSNIDRSGIFLGVIGSNIRNTDIRKSLSIADISGYPEPGNTYLFEVYDKKNQMKVYKNGKYFGKNTGPKCRGKMANFKRPLYFGIFMHYAKNQVTVIPTKGGLSFTPIDSPDRITNVKNIEPKDIISDSISSFWEYHRKSNQPSPTRERPNKGRGRITSDREESFPDIDEMMYKREEEQSFEFTFHEKAQLPKQRICPYCLTTCTRGGEGCKHTQCPKCSYWFCHVCLRVPSSGPSKLAFGPGVVWECGGAYEKCPKRYGKVIFQKQDMGNRRKWFIGFVDV